MHSVHVIYTYKDKLSDPAVELHHTTIPAHQRLYVSALKLRSTIYTASTDVARHPCYADGKEQAMKDVTKQLGNLNSGLDGRDFLLGEVSPFLGAKICHNVRLTSDLRMASVLTLARGKLHMQLHHCGQ